MSDREDLYAALIGEGAKGPEKSALIAAALRRQKEIGQLGQLTGDKVLSGLGKGMSGEVDRYATDLQGIRQHATDDEQTALYQGGQLAHMGETLAQQKQRDQWTHEYQMAMAAAAQDRANRPLGGGKIPKITQGDKKELQQLGETIGAIDGLQTFIQEGGKFGAVKVLEGKDGKGGIPLPGARALKNWAASSGMGSDADKASFLAKQNWDKAYNLAERNKLFGATLTPAELKSWAQASPSVSQTDEQIAAALPLMKKIFSHRLEKKVSGLMKDGYNPGAIAEYADVPGVNLPQTVEDTVLPTPPGAKVAPAGSSKTRMKKVDGKWVDVSGL